jgi:hypothetical protein
VLRDGAVALRFEWRVGVDWAGDATSAVSASATFPSVCGLLFYSSPLPTNEYPGHEADDRKALRQAPQAFDLLVKKYGVFNAINTLATLVFSTTEE